jgi:hypothetical protein
MAAIVEPLIGNQTAAITDAVPNVVDDSLYRSPYEACPICGKTVANICCMADCRGYPNWHAPLPETLRWVSCVECGHVFTDKFYTGAGLEELFRHTHPGQTATVNQEQQRMMWSPVVERVLQSLPDAKAIFEVEPLSWLDVGCGSGGLVFTAQEYGFAATGIDLRAEAVRQIRELGYEAHQGDLLGVAASKPIHVISMADLLEHTPYPVAMLRRAHELLDSRGVLFISCPNRECGSWRQMDAQKMNPYWREIEHYHNFSRKSLMWLLRQCGFVPVSYGVSNRYISCMEITARKVQ